MAKTLAEQCAERKRIRMRRDTPRFAPETAQRLQWLAANGFRASVGRRLLTAYYLAERNSRQRGIEFSLQLHELMALARRSQGRCEVTGIRFEVIEMTRKWDRQPWTASIDRIDCTKGYAISNCRLVCSAVNVALNSWGETVLERVAEGLIEQRLRHVDGYASKLRELCKKILRRNKRLRRAA